MTRGSFTRGTAVRIRLDDGAIVPGSVWAETDVEGEVWVALDDGRYARLNAGGRAKVCDGLGRTASPAIVGRVA